MLLRGFISLESERNIGTAYILYGPAEGSHIRTNDEDSKKPPRLPSRSFSTSPATLARLKIHII